MRVEGRRGCLFLRAQGETGGDSLVIQEAVSAHKAWLWKRIQEIVSIETGGSGDQELVEQILILFEGATGFGLIAVCYGFARFAFGLFLPQINADLSLSSTLSGLISGGSFLGYCIAIVLSALLTDRFGARSIAIGAVAGRGGGHARNSNGSFLLLARKYSDACGIGYWVSLTTYSRSCGHRHST